MTEEKMCLLQQAAQRRDIVSLKLCMCLYDICNDALFDFLTPLDFCNFLNLKYKQPVKVNSRQQLRVCYMVNSVRHAIRPKNDGAIWEEAFLEQCGITLNYYKSHYHDVCSQFATKDNENFRKDIDFAIERATRQNHTT